MPTNRSLALQAVTAVTHHIGHRVGRHPVGEARVLGSQPAFELFHGQPHRRRRRLCAVEAVRLVARLRCAGAEEVFRRAGLLALAGGIAPRTDRHQGAARRSRADTTKTTYGSARWADLRDVRAPACSAERRLSRPVRRALSAPRRPRARHGLCADAVRQGRRAGRADPSHLAGLGRRPRHQGRELAANRRLALAVLALPAVQSDRPALRALQPAARGAPGRHEVRDVQNIADILVDPEGALGAAQPLGEDQPLAAGRRHPARSLRGGRQDAARASPPSSPIRRDRSSARCGS